MKKPAIPLPDLTDEECEALAYDWPTWARPAQLAPSHDWRTWLILAGRGFGKTRTGAEWVRAAVESVGRVAIIAPTAADARDIMIEGESGILACCPSSKRPKYEPSKRRVTFGNGAIVTAYSADEPDRLRGPQHGAAWCDELASWRYPEAWDMMQMGLRLGSDPRAVVTTTPRPTTIIRRLMDDPTTAVTRGSTFDNKANLPGQFLAAIRARYEGTRLGRQELYAEVLTDTPGALWTHGLIEQHRVREAPELTRVVVAVDPAATSGEDSDETGIVVAGIDASGHGYVIADGSTRGTPRQWAEAAVELYRRFRADLIVAEANQGGEMVRHVLSTVDPSVPIRLVHASRGKHTRAEPISSLYEQGRVHHVGSLATLEDQMSSWVSGQSSKSPDRMDAMVWALTELMISQGELAFA